jgi:hypothetical protein
MARKRRTAEESAKILVELAREQGQSLENATAIIDLFPMFFRELMISSGFEMKSALALTTKFRDAGRRSAPWRAYSQRVPGRPQDGADGNRRNRWLLPVDNKQYADQTTATLVEIGFYLQALAFTNAPVVENADFAGAWTWLVDFEVKPGTYLDPLQRRPIDMRIVVANPRVITSGHIIPLDRQGRHAPNNVFLTLARSNQMQGNMTLPEFLRLAQEIVNRHILHGSFPDDVDIAQVELVEDVEDLSR